MVLFHCCSVSLCRVLLSFEEDIFVGGRVSEVVMELLLRVKSSEKSRKTIRIILLLFKNFQVSCDTVRPLFVSLILAG